MVVLFCGTDTSLMHSLCMICSLLNPKDFQTTDDDNDEWMIFVWSVCSLNIRQSFSQAAAAAAGCTHNDMIALHGWRLAVSLGALDLICREGVKEQSMQFKCQ